MHEILFVSLFSLLGGQFNARQYLVVDETLKSYKDIICSYGYCPRGEHAFSYLWEPADDQSRWSSISSMSIEGSVTNFLVNTTERSVDGALFMDVLKNDIFPMMNAYPGDRSVLLLDNCRIHQKDEIAIACAQRIGGLVLVLYLPPYSPDFSPIENMFHITKQKMQTHYGTEHGFSIREIFLGCLRSAVTPEVACKLFEKCYIHVTDEEKAWATR